MNKIIKTTAFALSTIFLSACSSSIEETITVDFSGITGDEEDANTKIAVFANNIDQDGPCEVYVHGNSAPASTFFTGILEQRKDNCTITFDMAGTGKSDDISSYHLPIHVETLGAVIDRFNLDNRKYSLICWSYGGEICTQAHFEGAASDATHMIYVANPTLDFSGKITDEFGNPIPPLRSDSFATHEIIPNNYHLTDDLSAPQLKLLTRAFYCPHNSTVEQCNAPDSFTNAVARTDGNFRADILPSIGDGDFINAVTYLKDLQNAKKETKGGTQGTTLCQIYGTMDAFINTDYMRALNSYIGYNFTAEIETGSHSLMSTVPETLSTALDLCLNR